jgi:hypothetical protein
MAQAAAAVAPALRARSRAASGGAGGISAVMNRTNSAALAMRKAAMPGSKVAADDEAGHVYAPGRDR